MKTNAERWLDEQITTLVKAIKYGEIWLSGQITISGAVLTGDVWTCRNCSDEIVVRSDGQSVISRLAIAYAGHNCPGGTE